MRLFTIGEGIATFGFVIIEIIGIWAVSKHYPLMTTVFFGMKIVVTLSSIWFAIETPAFWGHTISDILVLLVLPIYLCLLYKDPAFGPQVIYADLSDETEDELHEHLQMLKSPPQQTDFAN